jgi:hypothetical protein
MTGPEGTILSRRRKDLERVHPGKEQTSLTNKAKKSVNSTKRQVNARLEPSVGGYMLILEVSRGDPKGNQIKM